MKNAEFAHLHLHTQYSLLDGANRIPKLVEACKADGQGALALTDHGDALLELQVGNQAGEIRVTAALAVPIEAALDLRRAGLDRGQAVGHG